MNISNHSASEEYINSSRITDLKCQTHGIPPFQFFVSEYLLALHISRGNREVPIEGTPLQYVNLYKQCLNKNPETRPETKAVFETLDNFIPDNKNIRVNKGKGKEVIRETYEIASFSLDHKNMRVNKGKGKEVVRETHEVTSSSSVTSSSVSGNTRANKRKETASSSVGGNKRANKRKETVSSLFNRSIRVNKGNDANKYFKEGRFLKALELYEEIQGQQACCKLS
ncbi:kinase-like protein [Gigaspora margarita]|uniref:Kinase-like protein n=1 Tax=Gigaspora margarita TaxID=4874 RepID=A0A8H3X320_GIGMA|nr:kinase-like protein [Gigaspora margarita]